MKVPMNRSTVTACLEWRFLLLTGLTCAYLLAIPMIAGSWQVQIVLEGLLLATVLVTVSANPGWQKLRRVLVALWLVSVFGTAMSAFLNTPYLWQWYRTIELMTSVPILGVLVAGMLSYVRAQRRLTIDSIFATVAAYLMLALLFTQIYLFLVTWDPGSFVLPAGVDGRTADALQSDMTYFSLVTLATVGYGDILPATHTARMVAMFQAVVGQFYLAVVVALFVGTYAAQRRT
jgi:hypothetical protein